MFANRSHTGGFSMNDFTTKIIGCLAKGEKMMLRITKAIQISNTWVFYRIR